MASKQVTLIHNPNAGDDHQPTAGQLQALIKEAGYKVRYQSIQDDDWERALKRSADFIAVAGGDGTVTKVAKRLIGEEMPIAVLPMGTANNISKSLGIADLPVTKLIPSWKTARRLEFDVGAAYGPWGKRYFIEGAGVGLLSKTMPRVSTNKTLAQLDASEVKVTYAQQLLREYTAKTPAVEIEASLDGEDISGRYLLMEILNMQYIGPNLFLAPGIERSNGKLDVVLISEQRPNKLSSYIKHWQHGKIRPGDFDTRVGKRLKLKWTGFPLHFDDKIWPSKDKKRPKAPSEIEFRVEPRAICFLVPKETHEIQERINKTARKARKQKEK